MLLECESGSILMLHPGSKVGVGFQSVSEHRSSTGVPGDL